MEYEVEGVRLRERKLGERLWKKTVWCVDWAGRECHGSY